VLEEVRIRGLGVIAEAVLPLGRGLTVVTGETGAGKTMVVTGLLMLFGARTDSARVRTGESQASVDGRLDVAPDSPAAARVVEAGGDLDDGRGLVLRRVLNSGGRSRAYVGGAAAPVAVLGELAESLLAVHGQSDQVRLTRPAEQRQALDRFAGVSTEEYGQAYGRWREACAALDERTSRMGELQREADLLAHGIAEIEAAAPQAGEDLELAALAGRLAHGDALRFAAQTAHDALVGSADPGPDESDVSTLLGIARRGLAQQSGEDPVLDAMTSRLHDVATLVSDLAADLGGYVDGLDSDPARLAEVEARRAVLISLTRKYGGGADARVDDVLAWADRAGQRLADLDVSDEALAALAAERDSAAKQVAALASRIRAERVAAATTLSAAVTGELHGLAMPTAELLIGVRPRSDGRYHVEIDGDTCAVGPEGADDVEFGFRAAPGTALLPLGRGASGGELSRVMLALEVCLAGTDPVPTLVFDEVDAGVGGRAALEVGRRLARLAAGHQVVVVTHLAQVAAFADRHIVVDKPLRSDDRGVLASDVRLVEGAERVTELARMLAGSDTAAARQHAEELLADARSTGRAGAARPPKAAPRARRTASKGR
jgi:DNA repair protein RecN (Recombination protein N)